MKRAGILAIAGLVLLATPVVGGEYRCTASTQECLDHLVEALANRGWIGIEMENGEDGRYRLRRVVEDGPAEKAGLLVGDVLVAVNGARYGEASKKELKKAMGDMTPGTVLTYTVARGGRTFEQPVRMADMPDRIRYQIIGRHMQQHVSPAKEEESEPQKMALREMPLERVARLSRTGRATILDANGTKVREKFGMVPRAQLLTSAVDYDLKESLPASKDSTLIFYCANTRCTASDTAAERAIHAGYRDVYVLREGIMGWKDAGYPTVKVSG